MNLHMPQDVESDSELLNLAAVPYNIISPANNAPIIGIFQDSMLGSYLFTKSNVNFTKAQAMDLLMSVNNVNINIFNDKERITNFDLLSQILPPFSLKTKNKQYDDDEDKKTSNNIIEINNGEYIRGQLDKGILGGGTKGILQRICNDFGNIASADFIDNLQRMITDYMTKTSFSVGISDLISDNTIKDKIINVITDKKNKVKDIIDQTQLGIFENETGKTNQEEFEVRINNILNQATSEAGKIGLKSLSKDNHFVIMVNAGSKGSDLNIAQMIACLGQQNVDGKRIPYGFEHRTLPHYTKYDDSPTARGFVENSYINGLTPNELFFHAMGGRVGLIDTAVKSVIWETPIVIIEKGEAIYTEIGRWIDNKLDDSYNKENIQHFTERQMELLKVNGVFIPTTDEDGKVSWEEVTDITRHDPGVELYEIKTLGGRSVTVTESKSLIVWNGETKKFKEIPTPDIKIGDCLPVTMDLITPPIIKTNVDMTKYFDKKEYVYGTDFNKALRLMENEMNGRSKIPSYWWDENNGINFTLPYSKKSSLQRTKIRSNLINIKDGFIYPYHAQRNNTLISETFELNEENGIFIGLFLADGNVDTRNITITNNNTNITNFVKNWFDKKSIKWCEKNRINNIGGITNTITGNSSILSSFLTKFVGKGSLNKYVPTEAFISPECFIIGLLNGYFSGDGSISKNSIDVSSASKRLIEGISMLCSRIGVFGKIFKTQLKSNNLKTKNIKPSYRLSIRANWGKIFSDKISLLENNKNNKLKLIDFTKSHRNFETYNNVVLDKIIEINKIGVEKHPKVYDLTIPSTLNFGLANGLQVRDTSTTGYIQRRLIKSMEDLMVRYDGTVRSSKDFIIQFSYGDDGMDTTKVENQELKLVNMSIEDIYLHYNVPEEVVNKTLNYIFIKPTIIKFKKEMKEKDYIEKLKYYTSMMIDYRDEIVKKVFKYKDDYIVRCPVAFSYIINNVMGQQNINANSLVDITFLEAFELIENNYKKMEKIYYFPPKNLFKVLYYFYLSPRDILINKRFNKTALIILLETITLFYKKAIVAPGEMVGMIAGQSIGEPTTQLCECYTEHIRCVKINKNTKNISMLSGEIGKMCDDIIEKLPEYTFNTGRPNSVETLLEPLEDEYYIIGVDKEEKTHWNKISHISRHPVNGELMKITTRSGRSVTTTPAHSHLVRRNQQVVPIVGYDMKVGMRIPVAKHIDNDFVNDTIKIGEETFKLDYLFGWFIGAYLAEGSLTRKGKTGNVLANGSIIITNIDPLYIENVKKFASIFGKECKIREKEGRILNSKKIYKAIDTIFYHRELAEFINTTCGNGSFVKRVPDFAFLAPNEFKGGLIQGYFDGDGNFMNDKNHHQIRVCSRSFQLIKDISLLLAYFDIFGSIHTKPKHKIDMHYLAISSRYSVLYKENISSLLHIEKLDNLVDYTLRDNIHNLSDDIDRIEGLGIIIAECGKKLKLPGQSRNYGRWIKKEMNGIPIGRRTLQKYIDLFENNEKSYLIQDELKILNQAVSSNVIWDEIVDINFYTPDQSEYVYDFTVPQNQTFMNDNGIIVHNTLNSVTFETPIMVRNTNGEIQKVQIGQFTEDNIKTSPKIEYMKDKDTTYAELKDYYEVPSCDEDGNVSWKRIEAVTRHPVVNEDGTNVMLKITTKEQREVIATKAKSFLKLTNGKLIATNGSELKVGDYLPVSKKQINFEEKYELDLKSILPPSEYIYTSEMEKAKSVMNETFWWKKHSNKTFILPYSRSDNVVSKITGKREGRRNMEESFKPNCVYMKNNTMNVSCIPETIHLDYNFGYLVGAYAAEGCMTKHQISIANNDDNYFEPILKLCEKWNITTKKYKKENCEGNEGWTSQDLRIYNTMLCKLLEIFVGKLSHNKFISDKFIFSNKECLKGFLDGYIGGDGSIDIRSKTISISSVSKNMLIDTQQILNIFGIYSFITKPKKQETNNRGSKDIKQLYTICIVGNQIKRLANILNIKINYKQNALQDIINHTYMYEINRNNTIIPNEVDGKIIFEERTPDKYEDIIFDRIISIEEVSNTTNYAFDLTVEETRTFMLWNNLLVFDTFHSAGLSTKSNVTRGVPRIQEILSVTANPKEPSLTIYLKSQDETNKDMARSIMYMLEHTQLEEIVKTIEICFDPDDLDTLIEEDRETIKQYKEFENMFNECLEEEEVKNQNEKSKWILRMELDPSVMLKKNITMDDINFTLKNSYGDTITCIYSDYNSDKLIFRIRMNTIIKVAKNPQLSNIKNKQIKSLDQTDEIYFIKNFKNQLLKNIVLRGVKKINKVLLRKLKDNKEESAGIFVKKEIWVLDTIGTNLLEVLGLNYINQNKTFSNDIVETFNVLGIEAARQTIYNELSEVLEFDGTYINYHHMALLVDRMTYASNIISVFRHGINNDDIGPIAKTSFEETNGQFLKAAIHAELDIMRGVSANVMVGSTGFYGTSSFDIVLDMKQMAKLNEDINYEYENKDDEIQKLFQSNLENKQDYCSINNLKIDNNVVNINTSIMGEINDKYNPF